jgi:hypothetical protein
MSFVSNIQADQQCCDRFDNARVFQPATIKGPHAGDFPSQFARELTRLGVVTTDDNVAIERIVAIQQLC